MPGEDKKFKDLVWDAASLEILGKAETNNIDTCFARIDTQKNHCKFGTSGLCCRICHMGPCRITKNAPLGVCGADADTIVARNYLREVVGGTATAVEKGC
jgi:carbon-monoxide dehydrogenase catalytic subunit